MAQKDHNCHDEANTCRPVRVWDGPVRLFHWLLVLFVIVCVTTAKIGGNWMTTHMLSGYFVLALLIFRLVWGVVGGHHARFAAFVRGPGTVLQYTAGFTRSRAPRYLGHNPLGGWSVIAMLAALLLQSSTGLFASDDIFTEGPLYPLVGGATSTMLTRIHHINANGIGILVAVHLAAVLYYLFVKGENLIKSMVTGVKMWRGDVPPCGGNLWIAGLVAAISGALVIFIIGR
jgi:cytochrome b